MSSSLSGTEKIELEVDSAGDSCGSIPIRRPSQRPGTVAKELAAAKAASPGTTLDSKDEAPPPPPPGPPPDVPRTTVPVQRRNMQTLLGESPHKDDTEEAKYRV